MAGDPQTFSELCASVATWLNQNDLTAKIPEFIALAERRFNRILNVSEMEATATLVADASVALPPDFWEARALYLDTDPRRPLQEVSLAVLRSQYGAQSPGAARVYAITGDQLLLGPAPDAADSLILTYKQTIPALSGATPTNWLLTRHPDIYLYGSLLAAEAYIWNDARLPLWKGALDEALGELIQSGIRKRHGAAPLRLRSTVVV